MLIYMTFLLALFSYFYLGTIFRILEKIVPRPRPRAAINLEAESIEEEISREAKRRNEMLERLVKYSKKEPEKISTILASWLANGK